MEFDHLPRITASRSVPEVLTLEQVEIIGGPNGLTQLLANESDAAEKRRELISSIRGGKHVELVAPAITFRQRDGSPNSNFLRHKSSKLGELAESYKKAPLLVDHNKWAQRARIGTITGSELVDLPHNWKGFRQTLHVVKPDAVISVLDGTLDRFSIGWRPTGPVICTAHGTPVRGRNSCSCWPGDRVTGLDGKEVITEYEYQSAKGNETSAVNVPAVDGTKIEDVRAALAAELNFPPDEREKPMHFTRLAAVLGLAALADATDEDRAVRAAEDLKRGKLAAEQERDAARTELASAKEENTTLKAATKVAVSARIGGMLETAYREGKLLYARDAETGKALPSPREARLRKIADKDGLEALQAELAEMPVIAPVNKRVVQDGGNGGALAAAGAGATIQNPANAGDPGAAMNPALASVAAQLGLDVKDVEATYGRLVAGGEE